MNLLNVMFILSFQNENSLTLLVEYICRELILSRKYRRGKKKKAAPVSYGNAFTFLCGQEMYGINATIQTLKKNSSKRNLSITEYIFM